MDPNEWYSRMDKHPEIREKTYRDPGICAGCKGTGVVGHGNHGMQGVSGYWCRWLQVPVSGQKTCSRWASDRS